jgi:hypothetical protein
MSLIRKTDAVTRRSLGVGAAGAALTLLVSLPSGLLAQKGPGIPDLEAVWQRSGRAITPEHLALNARGAAMQQAIDEFQHPMYDCVPAAIPHVLGDPYNFSIEQLADRVNIHYEKDNITRTVWLEGHGHPAAKSSDFSVQGFSTGRYEDGDLIVVTDHFTYDPSGLEDKPPMVPSSTSKKVTERYSRDGDVLTVDATVEDRRFLTAPAVFKFQFKPTDAPLEEWIECDPSQASNALRYVPEQDLKYGIR